MPPVCGARAAGMLHESRHCLTEQIFAAGSKGCARDARRHPQPSTHMLQGSMFVSVCVPRVEARDLRPEVPA